MVDPKIPISFKFDVTVGKEVSFKDSVDIAVNAACVTSVFVPNKTDSYVDVCVAPALADAIDFQFLVVRPWLLGGEPIKAADLFGPSRAKMQAKSNVVGAVGGGAVNGALETLPDEAYLYYSVILSPSKTDAETIKNQKKPLRSSHIFAAGQTEWVTDMIEGGKPGGLTTLRFWNTKPCASIDLLPQDEKEKLLKAKPFVDALGKPLPDAELTKAKTEWAKGRSDITVQIVVGYNPKPKPLDDANKC